MRPEHQRVTDSSPLSSETLEEQRAWLERQADAAVAASGITEGWHQRGHIPEENTAWSAFPEDRSRIIGPLSLVECAGQGYGALDLGLNNDVELPDAAQVAEKMRTF